MTSQHILTWLSLLAIASSMPIPMATAASANVRDGFFQNPVLTHPLEKSEKHIKQLKSKTAYIMTLSDQEILRRMPVQTPRIHNACPSCRKGVRMRSKYWDYQEPAKSFGEVMKHNKVYDPKKPDQYVCPKCKEVYPNNPKYKQSHNKMMLNWAGEKIPVRYYQDPNGINYNNKGDDSPFPRNYYLDGVLDTERHDWIHNQMYNLALLYRLTGYLFMNMATFTESYLHGIWRVPGR